MLQLLATLSMPGSLLSKRMNESGLAYIPAESSTHESRPWQVAV